jgi:import inner membrane translocase subunit TIM8
METQLDLTKLSENDKKELNQVLNNEAQKGNIQQSEWTIYAILYLQ